MKSAILVLVMFLSVNAFAGGSIYREDAINQVAIENKELAHLLSRLQLSEVGGALRAGRHLENGGERLMPFTFTTKNSQFIVVIDYDEAGKISVLIK